MRREEPPFQDFSFTKHLHIIVLEPLDSLIPDEETGLRQSYDLKGNLKFLLREEENKHPELLAK